MGETYTSLGEQASWTYGAIMVLMFVGIVIKRWIVLKRFKILPTEIWGIIGFSAMAIWSENLPALWAYPVVFSVFGALLFLPHKLLYVPCNELAVDARKERKDKILTRVLGAAVVALSIGCYFHLDGSRDMVISVSDESVSWKSSSDAGEISRRDLWVNGSGPKFVWRMSTLWPSNKREFQFRGSELYQGSEGLVKGDDLGNMLAGWSGFKPEFMSNEELEAAHEDFKSRNSAGILKP